MIFNVFLICDFKSPHTPEINGRNPSFLSSWPAEDLAYTT